MKGKGTTDLNGGFIAVKKPILKPIHDENTAIEVNFKPVISLQGSKSNFKLNRDLRSSGSIKIPTRKSTRFDFSGGSSAMNFTNKMETLMSPKLKPLEIVDDINVDQIFDSNNLEKIEQAKKDDVAYFKSD